MKNYIKLSDFSLFNVSYVFIDSEEHLADQEFIKRKVKVNFIKDYQKPNESYQIIYCKVKKRDEEDFLDVLEYLPHKMSLMGYNDYESCCNKIISYFEENCE